MDHANLRVAGTSMTSLFLDGYVSRAVARPLVEYCRESLGGYDVLSVRLAEEIGKSQVAYVPRNVASVSWHNIRSSLYPIRPDGTGCPLELISKFLLADPANAVLFRGPGSSRQTDYRRMRTKVIDMPPNDSAGLGNEYLFADASDIGALIDIRGRGSEPSIGILVRWEMNLADGALPQKLSREEASSLAHEAQYVLIEAFDGEITAVIDLTGQ